MNETLDKIVEEIEKLKSHPELLGDKEHTTFIGGLNMALKIIDGYRNESKNK